MLEERAPWSLVKLRRRTAGRLVANPGASLVLRLSRNQVILSKKNPLRLAFALSYPSKAIQLDCDMVDWRLNVCWMATSFRDKSSFVSTVRGSAYPKFQKRRAGVASRFHDAFFPSFVLTLVFTINLFDFIYRALTIIQALLKLIY